jgi:hypothetical protein
MKEVIAMKHKIASLITIIPHFIDSREDSQTFKSLFAKSIKNFLQMSIDFKRARGI